MHIFDYRFLRYSSVDPDVVMRGWMSSSYWSRNGMAIPRRELVMAFDHSVIYARIRRNLNWMRSGSITPVL